MLSITEYSFSHQMIPAFICSLPRKRICSHGLKHLISERRIKKAFSITWLMQIPVARALGMVSILERLTVIRIICMFLEPAMAMTATTMKFVVGYHTI